MTLAALAATTRPALASPPAVDQRLAELERANNVFIGVFAADVDSGATVAHRAQDTFAMCSTFKGYAAGCVLQRVGRGELSLDRRVFVDPADILSNSPRSQQRAGTEMTLDELCQAAVQVSDNTAANLILETLGGPQTITAFARSIGDDRSRLDRTEIALNSAVPGDPRDTSTPEALGGGYRSLLVGDVLAPPQRLLLEQWLRANETSAIRPALPPGWASADKTGSGDYGTTNDVGVLYGPEGRRVVLAIMTRTAGDDPTAPNNRALIGEITSAVLPAVLA